MLVLEKLMLYMRFIRIMQYCSRSVFSIAACCTYILSTSPGVHSHPHHLRVHIFEYEIVGEFCRESVYQMQWDQDMHKALCLLIYVYTAALHGLFCL